MKKSFKLIVISPEEFRKGETAIVEELFSSGLAIFHLRKPSASKKEVASYLEKISQKYHNRIVVHSHYSLANLFDLKGIHLPEKIRKRGNFKNRKRKETISTSFHKIGDILKNRKKFEYTFLSPVYNSISKKNYKSNFIQEELRSLLKVKKNIIALGGINENDLEEVKQLGFFGAATLGYIWEAKDPIANFKKLLSKI